MSELTIHGPAPSSYVRTARWACAEKGVEHTLAKADDGMHPYKKFPILSHGDLVLPETHAIVHYIDAAFDGPSLIPADPTQRAVAEKIVSFINCYMYQHMVPSYALKYIFGGESPDRAAIDAAVPAIERDLCLLEECLGESDWFAGGDSLSIADLFAGPLLATVAAFPEGAASLETKPGLKKFLARIGKREAYQGVQPPRPTS